jgi:hypothetical protein
LATVGGKLGSTPEIHYVANPLQENGGEVSMVSKKSIRARLRQHMALHPRTYAHEHFAAVGHEVGQDVETIRICMLEGVVMMAYTIHCQRMKASEVNLVQPQDDDVFIATQAQRLATFGVTPEIARMALEQYPYE